MSTPRTHVSNLNVFQQMSSSCMGSLVVSVFMTPLDVVKVRLQTQERYYSKKCFLYSRGISDQLLKRLNGGPVPRALHTSEEICNCTWRHQPKFFNGTIDAFVKITRVEGVRSLWSGLTPTVVLTVPITVIYFTTYEQMKKHIKQSAGYSFFDPDPSWMSMMCGASARIWAVTVVSPLELIRTKMQSQKMGFGQVQQALKATIRSEGLFGLWRGYSATLLRDVPFSAIYWPCYEYFKPPEYNFNGILLAGAIAGAVASTATLPMDVLKTRFQIEMGEQVSVTRKSMSNMTLAYEIVTFEGWKGLFTGLVPRILKVAPACAIMISSYEYCKRLFSERNVIRNKHFNSSISEQQSFQFIND